MLRPKPSGPIEYTAEIEQSITDRLDGFGEEAATVSDSIHAMYARLSMFESSRHKLYSCSIHQPLEWPSHAVAFLPDRKRCEGCGDFALHQLLVGTQALPGSLNYIAAWEFAIPHDVEIDYGPEAEEEMDEGLHYTDVRAHSRLAQMIPMPAAVLKVAVSSNFSNVTAVAVAEPRVLIYNLDQRPPFSADPADAAPDVELVGHKKPGFALEWAPSSNLWESGGDSISSTGLIATGADDAGVGIWDLNGPLAELPGDLFEKARAASTSTTAAARNPRNATAAFGGGNRFASVTHPAGTTVRPLRMLRKHNDVVHDVSWHGSQSHVLSSASEDGNIILWDSRLPSGSAQIYQKAHAGAVRAVAMHPNAAFQLASGGDDGVVRLWDIRMHDSHTGSGGMDNRCSLELVYHTAPVVRIQWAPFDDACLLSGTSDGLIGLWNLERLAATALHQKKQAGATSIAPAPGAADGEGTAANTSNDVPAPPELVFVHAGHTGATLDAQFSPSMGDDWLIASTDAHNALQLFRPMKSAVGVNSVEDFDVDQTTQGE